MTDIPDGLIKPVLWRYQKPGLEQFKPFQIPDYADHGWTETPLYDLAAIRAVLDWQAKEWVEIPRLDRP